jgi:hypothetical protein
MCACKESHMHRDSVTHEHNSVNVFTYKHAYTRTVVSLFHTCASALGVSCRPVCAVCECVTTHAHSSTHVHTRNTHSPRTWSKNTNMTTLNETCRRRSTCTIRHVRRVETYTCTPSAPSRLAPFPSRYLWRLLVFAEAMLKALLQLALELVAPEKLALCDRAGVG